MLWILQDNLYKDTAMCALVAYLEKVDLPMVFVKVIPFSDGELSPAPLPEIVVPSVVIGSHTLNKYAINNQLTPGTWVNDNFNYRSYSKNYNDRMLNHEAVYGTVAEISKYVELNETYFLRPVNDSKAFTGLTMLGKDIKEWFDKVGGLEGIDEDEFNNIMICPVKQIYNETRFIAIDGKIVTGSQYRIGDEVVYAENTNDMLTEFAQQCVDDWQPADVFVIDIADTPDGMKVVEINNFNSAGWYHCNVPKIVNTLEEYGSRSWVSN